MSVIDLSFASDEAALTALGQRIARLRLNANRTQAQLAHAAGVSRRTISQIETGGSVTTGNLVRVLRALGLHQALDQLAPEVPVSPIQLAQTQGRTRQRARPGHAKSLAPTSGSEGPAWTWQE